MTTLIIAFLPILLITIFILLILTVFNKKMKFKKNFWNVNRISIVIICYIGLGLIALIYLSLSGQDEQKVISSEEIEQIAKDERQFYLQMEKGQGEEFNDKYLIDERSLKLTSEEVTLERESEDTYGNVYAIIDWRDDATSNEIYVKTYQIPYIYNGMNLSDGLTENPIEFTGNKLIVKKAPEQTFTFNSINPKIEMLEWNLNTTDNVVDNLISGSTFLYLNIPKHVTIIDEGELRFYP